MSKLDYLKSSKTGLLLAVLLCLFFITCNKDDTKDLPDDIMQDAVFYDGEINGGLINCEQNGETFQMYAAEGHVIVYFNDGVNFSTAKSTIENLGATIIEQIPTIGYYIAKVQGGKENDFISQIEKKNVEYVALDLIYDERACNENTVIIDNFTTIKTGETHTHGDKVGSVYASCVKSNVFCSINLGARLSTRTAVNKMTDNFQKMINMSFGPTLKNTSGEQIKWVQATDRQKLVFQQAQMQQIKDVVLRLKDMKKTGNNLSNTVVTIAAGNEALPDFYQTILVPMLNSGSSSEAKRYWLNSEEQKILKDNILIVTANDPSYSNQSSPHNAMAQVDISDLKSQGLTGTSYAAPRALCYINQIMEQNNMTAVQALAEAKKSIVNNNGLFVSPTPLVNIKPKVSISNIKSTTATATVIINPTEILIQYPDAVQVGVTISKSSAFSTYNYGNDNFNRTKSVYTFNCPALEPNTTYYVYGWVKHGSGYIEGRPENTASFKTLPEDTVSNSLAGTKWSCYAYGFNPADNCYLQGASGYLLFNNTTNVEFYNGNGSGGYGLELSGTYTLTGNSLNLNFGDVVFIGTVSNNSLQGTGKHYASATDIHNFRWNGTKQTTKSNIVLNKQQIIRTNRK